jgi:hypothetical protein
MSVLASVLNILGSGIVVIRVVTRAKKKKKKKKAVARIKANSELVRFHCIAFERLTEMMFFSHEA